MKKKPYVAPIVGEVRGPLTNWGRGFVGVGYIYINHLLNGFPE